jgi:hypothetical protein
MADETGLFSSNSSVSRRPLSNPSAGNTQCNRIAGFHLHLEFACQVSLLSIKTVLTDLTAGLIFPASLSPNPPNNSLAAFSKSQGLSR